MESYEKAFVYIGVAVGIVILGYFVAAFIKDMKTPVTVKWVYTQTGALDSVVVT